MSDADSKGANDDQMYQFLHQALGRDLCESEPGILPAATGWDHALLDVGSTAGALGSINDDIAPEQTGTGEQTTQPAERHGTGGECHPLQLHGKPRYQGREFFSWKLQVPFRNDLLMILLRSLCHHSAWLLIAGKLKPQNLQRSRWVQDLQEATMSRSSR